MTTVYEMAVLLSTPYKITEDQELNIWSSEQEQDLHIGVSVSRAMGLY